MFAPFGVEGSTCSRIIAKPSGRADTMRFSVGSHPRIEAIFKGVEEKISIANDVCYIKGVPIGKPCDDIPDDVIVTINDTAQFKTLTLAGRQRRCIVTFVPKCEFKPVESDELIPQASFPFAKFAKGKSSVNISFSVKGVNSTSVLRLYKDDELQCIWDGMNLFKGIGEKNCGKNLRIAMKARVAQPNCCAFNINSEPYGKLGK
nr:diagnostic antigen gp50 [Hymenolepis microstoma]